MRTSYYSGVWQVASASDRMVGQDDVPLVQVVLVEVLLVPDRETHRSKLCSVPKAHQRVLRILKSTARPTWTGR